MTARFPHCFGSSAICRFFCAIALAFSFATRAATVTGPIQNATGTPFNGQFRQFQFTPIGNPQVINGITVWTCPVTTLITNGTFSTNLDGGMYWVGYVGEGVNGQTPKVAKALVPPFDTNTYTLGQCLQFATNGSTFYWTNQPTLIAGTNVLFTTNGAYLVINSTASGGGLTTNQAALLTNSMQQGATILPSSITLGGSNVTTWAQLGGGGGNSGTATNLAGNALVQVSNVVTTATANTVTNGLYFYPENYGAVGNGNLAGTGNDDTAALQAAVNAAQLVGGTVFLSSKYYQISNSLFITNTVTLVGCGISTLGASYLTNGYGVDNLNVPTVAPYLLGSVLVQTSTNHTIFCTSLARALNLSNLGILVATNLGYQFAAAGGGVFCQAPPLGGLATNDIGIMSSEWKNVYVWGTGSNNFAFYHENGEYNNFTHLESFGCAGFGYLCSMQSPLGNFTLTESDFFCDAPTILPTLSIVGTSHNMGYATHILLNRVQALTYQTTQMYLNWRTPHLPFLDNVSAVNPANTFYVANASFVTVNRCAFEDQAAQKRGVVFPLAEGGNVWETASVMGSFPYAVMDNPSWSTITPSIFPDGISFGNQGVNLPVHKDLLRYYDYSVSSGSQYMLGVGLPDAYSVDNYITPNTSTYYWTWSGWDSNPSGLQTQHVLAKLFDGTGNFTNAGSITAGNGFYGDGSRLTNLPAGGVSTNAVKQIITNTVTAGYVNSLGYPNVTNFNNVVITNMAYAGYGTFGEVRVGGSISNAVAGMGISSDGITPVFKSYNYASNAAAPLNIYGRSISIQSDGGNIVLGGYLGVGNVGVNKTNPTNTLDVGGTIGDQYGQLPASTSILTNGYNFQFPYSVITNPPVIPSTNGFVTASITNGLATTNFVTGQGYVTASTTVSNATYAVTATNVTAATVINLGVATNTLPPGTLTSSVVTNGFLTTDGTTRSYSQNGQYLTNLQASAVTGTLGLGNLPSQVVTNSPPQSFYGFMANNSLNSGQSVCSISGINLGGSTSTEQRYSVPIGRVGWVTNFQWKVFSGVSLVGTNLALRFWTNGVQCGVVNLTITGSSANYYNVTDFSNSWYNTSITNTFSLVESNSAALPNSYQSWSFQIQ